MSDRTFKALVVKVSDDGDFIRSIEERSLSDLPEGDVLVRVHYSSLNYKDGMSASGHRGVTRRYPHTPGVDAAGVVEESHSSAFAEGDEVVVSGYDLGMNTPGGYGEYIRVPSDWILPLPPGLSLRESMVIGTAGFTAGMCVDALESHAVVPTSGPILVSGATGGVGSFAVALLSHAGYEVAAVSGKPDAAEYLKSLGATEIISREDAVDPSSKPMLTERWAGVVDSVGGDILETAIRSTISGGVVACCGLVASEKLESTVYPFILRGIALLGINSQTCEMSARKEIWKKLGGQWKINTLDRIGRDCTLENLDPEFERILEGRQQGRVVVDLNT